MQPHYPTQEELQGFRQSYILDYEYNLSGEKFAIRICSECGIADRHWPHFGYGRDFRFRAHPGELVYGVPMGTPK